MAVMEGTKAMAATDITSVMCVFPPAHACLSLKLSSFQPQAAAAAAASGGGGGYNYGDFGGYGGYGGYGYY